MTNEEHEHKRSRRGSWSALVISTIALLPFALVCWFFGALMTATSAGCNSPDEKPICSPTVQQWVGFYIPAIGLILSLLIVLGGGVRAIVKNRTAWGWIVGSWGPLILAVFVSYGIAMSGPNAEYVAKQEKQEQREEQRYIQNLETLPLLNSVQERYAEMQGQILEEIPDIVGALKYKDWTKATDPNLLRCGYAEQLGHKAKKLRVNATIMIEKGQVGRFVDTFQRVAKEYDYEVKERVVSDEGDFRVVMVGPYDQRYELDSTLSNERLNIYFETQCFPVRE